MNIDKTNPNIVSNYFRVPNEVKAETTNQKIAKAAAIAFTTLAAVATLGLSLLITFVAFKISDAREYKGVDAELLNFPDQEEEDFEGVDLELYHFPNQGDEEFILQAKEKVAAKSDYFKVATKFVQENAKFVQEHATLSLVVGTLAGIAIRTLYENAM